MNNKGRRSFEMNDGFKYCNKTVAYTSNDSQNDISKKIKNLEIEGLKLRNQVESILQEGNDTGRSYTADSLMDDESTETVHDLRFTHDYWNENRERNNAASYKTFNANTNYKPSMPPIIDDSLSVKRELEETKERLEYVEHKLKQEVDSSNVERSSLLKTIDEYKDKTYKLRRDLDSQNKEFQNREIGRDGMVAKLRTNLNQLLNINKQQEEALIETNERMGLIESAQISIKAVNQLRNLLKDLEYFRGQSIVEDHNSIDDCTPVGLVNVVDRCLRDLTEETDTTNEKYRNLVDEIEQIKRAAQREKDKAVVEMKNQLAYYEDENKYLKRQVDEVNQSADTELQKIKNETASIKCKLEDDLSHATSVIDGLEKNLNELSNKNKKSVEIWSGEKKKFEKMVDETEKELAVLRGERDQALSQKSSIMAKLDATQNKLCETETQLLQMESDKYTADRNFTDIKNRNKELEANLTSTRVYLENITKSIKTNNNKLINMSNVEDNEYEDEDISNSWVSNNDADVNNNGDVYIWKPKKWEIEQVINHIQSTNKKIADITKKYNDSKVSNELLQKQYDSVELQRKKLEQILKTKDLDIESLKNDSQHINGLMGNRNGEIERLTAERDYYFQMLNDKTEELADTRAENQRLIYTFSSSVDLININCRELEERCRQLESNNLQSSKYPSSHHSNTDSGPVKQNVLREERIKLTQQLNEMKLMREQLLNENRDHISVIESLKLENNSIQAELRNAYQDYEDIQAENKRLQIKLKDAQVEIANLCRELQANNSPQKSRKHINLEKKISELNSELSSTKIELKLAHQRLREIDKKPYITKQIPIVLNEFPAPDVVGKEHSLSDNKMQITKKRLLNLEKQMNSVQASHKAVLSENTKLTTLLKKVTSQNERLTEELENYVDENNRLRKKICTSALSTKSANNETEYNNYGHNQSKRKLNSSEKLTDCSKSTDKSNSIKTLRDDLQNSIREARKLLSHKYNKNGYNLDNAITASSPSNTPFQDRNNNDPKVDDDTDNADADAEADVNADKKYYRKDDDEDNNNNSSDVDGSNERKFISGTEDSETLNNTTSNSQKNIPDNIFRIRNLETPTRQINNNNNVKYKSRNNNKTITKKHSNNVEDEIGIDIKSSARSGSAINGETTIRSDCGSLTEVDRHHMLNNSTNKKKFGNSDDVKLNESVKVESVDTLLSANNNNIDTIHPSNAYQKRSNRESYVLEEKIKRLLTET